MVKNAARRAPLAMPVLIAWSLLATSPSRAADPAQTTGLKPAPVKRNLSKSPSRVPPPLPLTRLAADPPNVAQPNSDPSLPAPVTDPRLPPPSEADIEAREKLEEVEAESKASAGAIFVSPEKIYVQQPLLQALITINKQLPPYALDADKDRPINLRDVIQQTSNANLDIRIAREETLAKKWLWIGSLGNFLPTLSNELTYQGLSGAYISPSSLALKIKNGYLNTNDTIAWTLFKGGQYLFQAAQARHNYAASTFGLKGTTNDVLLQATKLYYNLVLNDALLQIRVKSVETSKALLIVNQDFFENGVNTYLDVLEAKYQLSRDRQKLIQQQVDRRESAVQLATAIYINPEQDLTLSRRLIPKIRLVDDSLKVNDLIRIAVASRPELKRYEELRRAALDQIKISRAPLLPQVTASGSVVGSAAKIFTDTSSTTSSSNQGTGLGSSGGASVGSVGGSGGAASGLPLAQGSSGARKEAGRSLFIIGLDLQWTLGGLGVPAIGNVQSAKATARKVQLEFQKSLYDIYQQVRDAYLSSMAAEKLIEETTDAVNHGDEKLRVAQLRFTEGVGTYLDVVYAQRDLEEALVNKAKALVQFNTSQAQLLWAIGRISKDTVLSRAPLKA